MAREELKQARASGRKRQRRTNIRQQGALVRQARPLGGPNDLFVLRHSLDGFVRRLTLVGAGHGWLPAVVSVEGLACLLSFATNPLAAKPMLTPKSR